MQKKSLLLIFVLVLFALVGSVFAQDDPLAEVDPSGVTVVYQHEWDGQQLVGLDQIIADFNESNEYGITVVSEPLGRSSDVRTAISNGIDTGELPNLGGAGFVNDAMGYFQAGVLVPLDQYLDSPTWGFSEEEATALNFDLIDRNRASGEPFNGQLLAWPIGFSAEIMSTNVTLLDAMREQGLIDFEGIPSNTEEFAAAACAAGELDGVTAGYGARATGFHAYTWMLNFGGDLFDEEADAYTFTDEGSLAGLQFVQDLYNDGCIYFPDGGNFANTGEFSLGLNVFAPGSSVGVPFIQGDMDSAVEEGVIEAGFDWVNVPFPSNVGTQHIVQSLRGVVLLDNSPEANLATWLFIKYWATNAEAQSAWIQNAQYQPVNSETTANLPQDFLDSNAQFTSFANVIADGDVAFPALPNHVNSFGVSTVAGEMISNITLGGMDVMEAATAAQEEANRIYQEDLADLVD